MNDDQYFLANAYLDGELADDERSIAEADPAVMAEVEVLRGLQAEMRAVDAPTAAARESAIDAAMTEFTARDAVVATPAAATAPVVPFRPRPAYSRYLGVAAAVVAVGVLGVVIVNGVGGGGDNDASMAEPAALDEADAADDGGLTRAADRDVIESVSPTVPANATAAIAADEATGDATGDVAEDAEDDMAAAEMADEGMSAEMSEEAEAVPESAADADTFRDVDVAYDTTTARLPLERPDIDVEATITDDAELGAYGTYLLELRNDSALGSTPNTECDPSYNILDDAPALINRVEVTVYIAVQEDDERVIAIDRDTCEELVDGPLFPTTDP